MSIKCDPKVVANLPQAERKVRRIECDRNLSDEEKKARIDTFNNGLSFEQKEQNKQDRITKTKTKQTKTYTAGKYTAKIIPVALAAASGVNDLVEEINAENEEKKVLARCPQPKRKKKSLNLADYSWTPDCGGPQPKDTYRAEKYPHMVNTPRCEWGIYDLIGKAVDKGQSEDGFDVGDIGLIFEFLDSLTSPRNPYDCLAPWFNKFYNLVPVHFYIARITHDLLKSAAGGLAVNRRKLEQKLVDTPCGQEILNQFDEQLDSPFGPFPQIPAIPPIPMIQIPDKWSILKTLIIDYLCGQICCVFTPIVANLTLMMEELDRRYAEWDPDADGENANLIPPMKKINLKFYITNDTILESGKQEYVFKDPNISDEEFIDSIYSIFDYLQAHEEIEQKHIIFLLLGEADCFVVGKLEELFNSKSEYKKLIHEPFPLTARKEEDRILEFFKFLGSYINVFKLIKDSKSDDCPPNPCAFLTEEQLMEELADLIKQLCGLLDQGAPPIPLSRILEGTGGDEFVVDAIKMTTDSLYDKAYNIITPTFEVQDSINELDLNGDPKVNPSDHNLISLIKKYVSIKNVEYRDVFSSSKVYAKYEAATLVYVVPHKGKNLIAYKRDLPSAPKQYLNSLMNKFKNKNQMDISIDIEKIKLNVKVTTSKEELLRAEKAMLSGVSKNVYGMLSKNIPSFMNSGVGLSYKPPNAKPGDDPRTITYEAIFYSKDIKRRYDKGVNPPSENIKDFYDKNIKGKTLKSESAVTKIVQSARDFDVTKKYFTNIKEYYEKQKQKQIEDFKKMQLAGKKKANIV